MSMSINDWVYVIANAGIGGAIALVLILKVIPILVKISGTLNQLMVHMETLTKSHNDLIDKLLQMLDRRIGS